MVADNLSRLVNEDVTSKEAEIKDKFPDESLFLIAGRPWFADMANFKEAGVIPKDLNWHQRKKKKFMMPDIIFGMIHTCSK